jgi:HEAT repeat protein
MMHVQTGLVLLLCTLACGGCSTGKSTDELIADLKSGTEIEGVKAARTLPRGKEDAAKVVPALIEGLKHSSNDIRRSSALKLGEFKELAKDAIPALQKAEQDDGDARVREAAGIVLSRIDPERFPHYTYKTKTPKGRSGVVSQNRKR